MSIHERLTTPKQSVPYGEVLCTPTEVNERIHKMAAEVIERYKDYPVPPLFVCLLRGGVPFTSRLMTAVAEHDMNFQPDLDYMKVKTYGEQLAAGKPEILFGLEARTVTGR